MKAMKWVATIVLVIMLLIAESILMGIFSVDRATSEKTINSALKETDLVDQLVDEAISESTVSMGGEYGEVVQEAVNTDAMRDLFSAYITSAIRSGMYDGNYEEIGEDDLMTAFSSAVDELNDSGKIDISSTEKSLIMARIEQEIPDLADDLNSIVEQYDTTSGEAAQEVTGSDVVQKLMNLGTRIVMILICAGIIAALIAIFWRSKAGFILCGIVTAIVSLVYLALTALGRGTTIFNLTDSPADQFALTVLADGFKTTAIEGFVVAGILIVMYIVFKIRDRRRAA